MPPKKRYDEDLNEDIHFLVTLSQKRIYDSWGRKKNDILRELITMRALGKDETQKRLLELDQIIKDAEKERVDLQATLEDVLGPAQDKANVIVRNFIELGRSDYPPEAQKAWVDGQTGGDSVLAALVWDLIQDRGGDDWGGE